MSPLTRSPIPMKPLAKILIAGTATLMLTLSSAYADGSNDILNGQVNLNAQQATLSLATNEVAGNISGGATAGGNASNIMALNNPNVTNNQYVGNAGVGADTSAYIT